MHIQYSPAANDDDYEGSSEGACVSGMTDDDEDYVVRMLPANQILYHCLCAGEVGGQGTSSRCSVLRSVIP